MLNSEREGSCGGGGPHSGVQLVFVDGLWRCPVEGCQHTQEPFEPWERLREVLHKRRAVKP